MSRNLGANRRIDAVIVTDARAPQACFEQMVIAAEERGIGAERVLAPELLRITLRPRRAKAAQ